MVYIFSAKTTLQSLRQSNKRIKSYCVKAAKKGEKTCLYILCGSCKEWEQV